MSLRGNLRQACDVYRVTEGTTYPATETWTRVAQAVPCLKSVSDRSEQLRNGSIDHVSVERIRMVPRDLTAKDRLVVAGNVYEIEGEPEDVDGLGRELVVLVSRLPKGTAAEMGIS